MRKLNNIASLVRIKGKKRLENWFKIGTFLSPANPRQIPRQYLKDIPATNSMQFNHYRNYMFKNEIS